MIRWGSTPEANPASEAHEALPVRSEVRLRMKAIPAAHGLDGAWWPRSHDPETEFPELVLAMNSWVGPVSRVTYHVSDWDAAEHQVTIGGWLVNLANSAGLERHTVRVTGTHQRERTLVVVPPDVPGGVARAVLRAVAGPDVTLSAEEMLSGNGVRTDLRGVDTAPTRH